MNVGKIFADSLVSMNEQCPFLIPVILILFVANKLAKRKSH